ncbi:hypothetical protein AP071_15815 [Rhodobacter capsulatus]|nr:hypothetical protein AP073_15715 [Rhodobacter capsulatus]KQB14220.1 hypothetical protein AP071_15815 [Rhodobacter capsulatus]
MNDTVASSEAFDGPMGETAEELTEVPLMSDAAQVAQMTEMPDEGVAAVKEDVTVSAALNEEIENEGNFDTVISVPLEEFRAELQIEAQPCQEAEIDTDDLPAVWTASKSLESLITDYLNDGETALAWHLTSLASESGFETPIPAPLLKALAAAPMITGPYDHSMQVMGEILADAMSAVDSTEEQGAAAELRARSIAFAALLRPALMARDTNAREHLANLSMAGGLSGYASLANTLAGLRHDLQPGLADLNDLVGAEQTRRLPQISSEIRDWLPRARAAQTMHAPSSVVLHNLLAPDHTLGRLLEAALTQDLAKVEEELDFLSSLAESRATAEALVEEEERALDRPRRDRIRGMAFDWIWRRLQEGACLLLRWQEAARVDACSDDRRREELRRVVNNLRKELTSVRSWSSQEDGLDSAVQRRLDAAIEDLIAAVEGKQSSGSRLRVLEALDWPLTRLRGPCQPFERDGERFDAEVRERRAVLFDTLRLPARVAKTEIEALEWHIEDAAILPARSLLANLERDQVLPAEQIERLRQRIEEARVAAEQRAKDMMMALRHELEPLQSIDLQESQKIQIWLDRLQVISEAIAGRSGELCLPMHDDVRSPDVPPDFPQLWPLLDQARVLRDDVRTRIMGEQKARLEALASRFDADRRADLAREAREVMAELADSDLITVEDTLIRLQDGQSLLAQREESEDHFATFYPGFVTDVTAASIEMGAIMQAIEAGARIDPLDYSALEENNRARSKDLLENWRQVGNSMRSNRADLSGALQRFIERLGFTSVVIEKETTLTPNLRWMRMRADVPVATHWFLPPVFGSGSGGSYPIFLARREVEDAQLVSELAKIGRDAPCILLVFDRMTKARREGFALAMRRAKQTVLLIDETQVLYLSTRSSWMERIFACATPFGYLQPYTTSSGNIPSEMFFGREKEIAAIESVENNGCLVYGGRQLGKSALLHHVRKRFDQPVTGRRAYYLKIDEFGGPVQPATQIWEEIRRVLIPDQVVPKTADSPENIAAAILDWLARGGERRILFLIDEADMFLASEVRNNFPNLNRLKDMMESSARRFKVVFAGLHNVRRLAKAPNSPLVHLGEPICIGPLNTSAESGHQARRLVIEPMKAAGFDYAAPDLVHALLTRVNYYPSLVQVFCKALLEGIANLPRPPGTGPRWRLNKEQLFESSSAGGIRSQIRERFQWTLNLDPRYELIAKVLALHRLEGADASGGAMSVAELMREVDVFWPRDFERLNPDDFRAFLDEMVDLGVLIQQSPGRYGLRGAQVAQMLGDREQLENEIEEIATKEPRVDYDPGLYHRRLRASSGEQRAPLSDGSLATLLDPRKPGLRFVVATSAVWGNDLPKLLAEIAKDWQAQDGRLTGDVFRGTESELRSAVDRGQSRHVIVFSASGRISPAWLIWLRKHPRVLRGDILPVFIGDPEHIAALLPNGPVEGDFGLYKARSWERTMVRAWLAEFGLSVLDTPDCREAILSVTGGVPAFMPKLRPKLEAIVAQGRGGDFEPRIRDLAGEFQLRPADVGLPDTLVPMFCTVAEWLGVEYQPQRSTGGRWKAENVDDLVELLASEGNANPDRALRQMADLGLLLREQDQVSLTHLGALLARSAEAPATRKG